jgi:hypothetical protein
VIVHGICIRGGGELSQIAQTLHSPGLLLRGGERREEQPDEQSDDADHDEQFDQSETDGSPGKCGWAMRHGSASAQA